MLFKQIDLDETLQVFPFSDSGKTPNFIILYTQDLEHACYNVSSDPLLYRILESFHQDSDFLSEKLFTMLAEFATRGIEVPTKIN